MGLLVPGGWGCGNEPGLWTLILNGCGGPVPAHASPTGMGGPAYLDGLLHCRARALTRRTAHGTDTHARRWIFQAGMKGEPAAGSTPQILCNRA